MDNLLTFTNEEFGNIRTVEENGKIYFCGKDVATALGYAIPHKAIKDNCRWVLKQNVPHPQNPSKQIEMSFIPEGDLYRLITHSKLPTAEKFEKWVFDEVLPTIRTTGQYLTPVSNDSPLPVPIGIPEAKDYLQAAKLIAHCPKDRLRIVVNLFENGGFDMSDANDYLKLVDTGDTSLRISEAMRITGLGVEQLAQHCGIPTESFRSYYRMRRYPKPDRYLEIIEALNNLIVKYEVICK